jgi:acetoin utilization deacetylase AcuC-like enzyme
MNVFFSPDYVGSTYAFETTRKAKWVADSLTSAPINDIALLPPLPLSYDHVVKVHDPIYVQAVQTGFPRSLAESQEFHWDAGLWPMVLASNGGAVAAALDAMQHGVAGSLSSGLHHARYGIGAGYCTFNGLVISARQALAAGASAVLILDLDAHCGGGSASLIANDSRIWQLDVSVDSYDSYDGSARARLRLVKRGEDYLGEIESGLREIVRQGQQFDLCLYNAGMDPFEGCPDGGLIGITKEMLAARERLVFEWCRRQGLAVAFMLAGGYIGEQLDADGLVDLHRLTISAAVESGRGGPGNSFQCGSVP